MDLDVLLNSMPFISWGYLLPYFLTVFKTSTLFSWTTHAMNYGPTSLWKSCNSVYATHSTDILLLFRSIINCIFRPQLSQKKTCHSQGMKETHIQQPYLEGKLQTPSRCSTHNIILQLALAKEKIPFELELIGNRHPTTIEIYH